MNVHVCVRITRTLAHSQYTNVEKQNHIHTSKSKRGIYCIVTKHNNKKNKQEFAQDKAESYGYKQIISRSLLYSHTNHYRL